MITEYDRAKLLVEAVQELAIARTVQDVRETVRSAARIVAGADGATFVLRDNGQCHYVDEDAIEPLWKGQRFPMEACISGHAMIHREAVPISDIYSDPRVPHDAYRPTFVKSMLMVPIRQVDPVGAIGVYWAKPHAPSDQETELLQALADSTAVAMANVQALAQLEQARLETLMRLALAAEYRDDDTAQHTQRVAHTSALIAEQLGIPEEPRELLRQGAALHDIGKIAVPDSVLLKPGKLTDAEFATMRTHPTAGAAMLAGSSSDALRVAAEVAVSHHERWDGSGYPSRVGETEIPLSGRIVAVADVFDSLTHERPYKSAWSVREAVDEIHACSGTHFDPIVVEAFDALDPNELVAGPTYEAGAPML
ncbi:MAG: HD domain-containing protein [Solirubrobacteraceae bacterium]|nr:HD domain-containing protein [Solirubrobacteraceae bacterium]